MSNEFITDKQWYDILHEKYFCLPDIGILIDKKTFDLVGTLNADGYIITSLQGKTVGVHRIVFCMFHGYFPKITDHINRNRADNRIENLREISASGNVINTDVHKDNHSGIKGVRWLRYDKRWKVTITGNFVNFINAVRARYYAEQKLGYNEYDIVSSAQKYLMCIGKFSFSSNIEIDKEERYNKNSVDNEWNFFCLEKKQKIDKLIKK